MNKFNTNSLFYNKYLYKLCFLNGLASVFRNKNLKYAGQHLDDLQRDYLDGNPLYFSKKLRHIPISVSDFTDSKILYNKLSNVRDYGLRINHPNLCLYSNDYSWLESIAGAISAKCSIYFPEEEVKKLLDKDILYKEQSDYKYRVTLNFEATDKLGFWLENNLDKVKCQKDLINDLKEGRGTYGRTFYVKDDNHLMLANLVCSVGFLKIQKIVTKQ